MTIPTVAKVGMRGPGNFVIRKSDQEWIAIDDDRLWGELVPEAVAELPSPIQDIEQKILR